MRPKGRSLRPIAGLLPFLRPYKSVIAGAFVALVASTAVTLAVPVTVRLLIDQGFSRENAAAIDDTFLLLLFVAGLMAVTTAVRFFLVSWIGERVVADLRSAVFDHVVGLSPEFFERNQSGEVLSRLTADTTLVRTVVGSTASLALRSTFTGIGATAMLVVTSPTLSGLVLLAIPLTALPILGFGRWVRRLSRTSQDRLADTNVFAGEALRHIQIVQAYSHEDADRSRYREVVEQAFRAARRRLQARAGLTTLGIFLVFALITGILWVGAQAVLSGDMSPGELGQFIFYAMFCASSLATLTEMWGEVQLAAGAAERLFELLAASSDVRDPARPVPLREDGATEVRFDAVRFAYPTRPGVLALDDFSLSLKSGETVALVGPSGAGKSTVLRLLLRFYDPQAGRILLDGIDIRDLRLRDLRSQLAVVPQEPAIFSESVSENIRYGRPDASPAEVRRAAEMALVDEFVRALPEGYATRLGENGMTLSGGQRQRMAIARAILKDAPILLLDEATSSLDSQNEQRVQQALATLRQGRATLVVAHRLATVLEADRLAVVDHGRLVAQGSHETLLQQDGLYRDLAELQLR
jgi:ATP-binding cassette subfamily B protein